MSAVCRCTAGPGGPTSGGAVRAASGGTVHAASGCTVLAASGGAVHASSGGTVVAGTVVAGGAIGSGAATGTSLPTRTCDHGTNGPRNGGAASGGRGTVYGSAVHVGRTSSGRCAG
jgi:hypothetical protein